MRSPRKTETKRCVNCLKEFTAVVAPHDSRWQQRLYCSVPCCAAFRRRQRHGIAHPREVQAHLSASTQTPSKEAASTWLIGTTHQADGYKKKNSLH